MPSLRTGSIRAKLFAIVMITTTSSLVITAISMTVFELRSYREATARKVLTLANVIGINSTAALEFQDPAAATEILRVSSSQPEILSACLYDKTSALLARYSRPGQAPRCPDHAAGEGIERRPAGIIVMQPVLLRGQRIGTLRL